MQQTQYFPRRAWRRLLSLALAAVMILGLVPGLPGADSAASAHWADPYLSQLVEWGFIRADQADNPNRALTRADFMAIVNRAYGYHTPGGTPFEDVKATDWFYDDVGIAYNARYIKGTSPTTASPNEPLTRETSATILGRNMMLQESAGEILDFTDARRISNWAKGTIKSSLEHYLISGYDDGTFRPQRNVSWGEMAAMVTKIIGTPLQEPGDYALGGTFGNVTISSPGVTLRDTVVSGDLYVTGGVGLGDVKLENVTVLGRIICSGTGSSEGGSASIILRNVTADEMLIDNLEDREVSVQADGITEIGRTTVRTSAYIEDNTPDGMGLKYISLEGETYPEGEEPEGWEPPTLTLAGRIEEVVNRTPESTVHVGAGTVAKLTVDEAAVDSNVIIDRGAVVKELNLDTATLVTGEGDIEHLIVNAPGCEVEMLPDKITIRPGITAIIAGEEMDTVAAEESSQEPLILAGYPEAQDITPTGLLGAFMTNKSGTVYWAVSPVTEGSVGEDDLIKPPSYGSIAVAHGSVKAPKGNEEFTTAISGLTPGGSYYLSAVLVDARDHRSPVKVIAFETPDNTIPAFCPGYPHMSKVSPKDAVTVVMPTKDCKLYYALLPQNAVAPTADEMKTNAVAGALGYGVRDVKKNIEDVFRVNDVTLEEKTTYVLYFFLTDGVNNSPVTSLTFTTDDETPPEFIVDPTVVDVKATSVGLTFRLNEDGIVYWVAVPAGTVYPKPEPGTDYDTAPLDSDYAKLQVSSGMNIGSNGKAGRVNAKENADGKINVSGLKAESAYDFYYLAKDNAGPDKNYSLVVKKITINTLDTNGPKFSQSFSKVSGTDKTKDPMSDTAIYLDITENVRYNGEGGGRSFLELYQDISAAGDNAARDAAINKMAANLFNSIVLHKVSMQDNSEETIIRKRETSYTQDDWTIDYTQATITTLTTGGVRITFPSDALHLENGGKYYFTIENVSDTSNNQNEVVPNPVDFFRNEAASKAAGHNVPPFVVEFARVDFSSPGVGSTDGPVVNPGAATDEEKYARVDMSFRMTPVSTETVSDMISYDVLLWTGSQLKFDLYYRVVDPSGNKILVNGAYPSTYTYEDPNTKEQTTVTDYLLPRLGGKTNTPDANGWINLGNSSDVNPTSGQESGRSVNKYFNGCGSTSFPKLNKLSSDLRYEFVIHLTSLGDIAEKDAAGTETWKNWNGEVKFHVNVAAGQSNNLDNLAGSLTPANWKTAKERDINGGARSIGRWYDYNNQQTDTLELSRLFTDSRLPRFEGSSPIFENIQSTSTDVILQMSTSGTVYYAVGKAKTGSDGVAEITTTRQTMKKTPDGSTNQADKNKGGLLAVTGENNTYYIRMTDVDAKGNSLAPTDSGASMQEWMRGSEGDGADDPQKPNLIMKPQPNWIFNPGSQVETATAITGNFPFKGRVRETFTIDKLTPETDYFAYFVIKGEADTLSHVYIYHFKTPKASKPKIDLGRYNADNKAGATIGTDIDSRLNYFVFTLSDARNHINILDRDFSGANIETGLTLPAAFSNMKVLDALLQTYQGEDPSRPDTDRGFSVFDIYASHSLKVEMSNFLRGRYLSTFLDTNVDVVDRSASEISLKGGVSKEQTLKLYDGTDFVILAVAHVPNPNSTDEAEIDTYAAYAPLRTGVAQPPNVKSWVANILSGTAADSKYPGVVSITFDRPLYLDNTGNTSALLTSDKASALLTKGTWIPSNGADPITNRISPKVVTDANQTTITFETNSNGGWMHGDYIQIQGSQLFSANGIPCSNDLIVQVRKDSKGVYIDLTYGTQKQTFPYLFAEDADISVYISVPDASGRADLTLEGEPQATQTLYVDSATGSPIQFTSTIAPPQYAADSQYVWRSSRDSVIALQAGDDGHGQNATFDLKGEGEATISLTVVTSPPGGARPITTTKEIKVIVGHSLSLTSATGSGNSVSADVPNRTARVTVSPSNPNPELTFVFSSVRPVGSTSVTTTYAPDVFTAKSTNLSTDGKTITVKATVGTLPLTAAESKLTLQVGTTSLEVVIGFSGSQTPLNPGGGSGAGISVNPFGT